MVGVRRPDWRHYSSIGRTKLTPFFVGLINVCVKYINADADLSFVCFLGFFHGSLFLCIWFSRRGVKKIPSFRGLFFSAFIWKGIYRRVYGKECPSCIMATYTMMWMLRALWLVVAHDLHRWRHAKLVLLVLFNMARGFENVCDIISL